MHPFALFTENIARPKPTFGERGLPAADTELAAAVGGLQTSQFDVFVLMCRRYMIGGASQLMSDYLILCGINCSAG